MDNHLYNKIDIVYTWVNGSDKKWRSVKSDFLNTAKFKDMRNSFNKEYNLVHRYRNRDELKYSLRGIHKNAPWINHIYIVTCGHIPKWLNVKHPQITMIKHSDIMPPDHLPTFNSMAIEANIHKIPGLSPYFIYSNDDVFVNRPITVSDFIEQSTGKIKIYFQEKPSDKRCNYLLKLEKDLNTASCIEDEKCDIDATRQFVNKCYNLEIYTLKGIPNISEIGYNSQWKNTNRLLDREFVTEPRIPIAHIPQIQTIEICKAVNRQYPQAIANTSNSPFRSIFCYGTTNALYPYYGIYTKKAIGVYKDNELFRLFLTSNETINKMQYDLLKRFKPKFLCVQDSTSKRDCNLFIQFTTFMDELFPEKSPYEQTF